MCEFCKRNGTLQMRQSRSRHQIVLMCFIGIELDDNYFEVAKNRIAETDIHRTNEDNEEGDNGSSHDRELSTLSWRLLGCDERH